MEQSGKGNPKHYMLTADQLERLAEAAEWEVTEATGDTSEIEAVIAQAIEWAKRMRAEGY